MYHVRELVFFRENIYMYMKVLGLNPSWILIFQVLAGNDLAQLFKD